MYGFTPEKMKKQAKAEGPGLGFKPRSAAHAQALNQAPDTIPGMFKPGEFVLPPDTVHAMGGPEALQGVVDATHTPAPDTAAVPRGFQPQVFFAQGGSVDDEVSRQKANSFGDAAAAAADPAVRQVQPAPNSPSNTFPGNRLPGDSGSTSAPPPVAPSTSAPPATAPSTRVDVSAGTLPQEQGDPFLSTPKARAGLTQGQQPTAAPSAPTAPAPADPGGFSYADNNKAVGQDIKDSWNKGNYGEAVGKTVAGSVGMFTTPIIDVATRGGAAAWDGAKGFASGLFGMESPSVSATPAKPAGTASQVPATSQTEPSGTNPAAAAKPAPQPARAPDATTETAAEKPPQVMPGVYQHGRGQYSDQAGGMGLPQNFTGQPNFQNNAAAENLARGFQPGASQTRVSGPAGVTAPTVLHSGNSWQARNDLRNLEVGASSITNTRRFGGKGFESNPDLVAYRAAVEADNALKRAQPGVDVAAMRENAGIQREGMQQDGATTRTGIQEDGANARAGARFALEGQELGLKREAQGFQTRAAKRMEDLQARYQAAGTEQERATIAKQIRDLSGKDDQANRFTVVPGGQEWDAAAGAMRNVPARVLNNQTGQFVEQPGHGGQAQAPQDAAQRQVGMTYLLPNGKTGRWTEKGWLLVS